MDDQLDDNQTDPVIGPHTTHRKDLPQPSFNGKHRAIPGNGLPERYTIKTIDEDRVIICLEAPNLKVHIHSGLTVSNSVARKSPSGTIFLDGVAQSEPFLDHERQVYNFDHHEGCVRAFTMATCEQTLVMHMKGFDLQSREWNIFANEPDLDTVLAIWILLNHARINRQDSTQRRILFALVRYEGIIDALGLELRELSALPAELMQKIQRVVDHLRSTEVSLKRTNQWEETDFLEYTSKILHKIDQIFYRVDDFKDYLGIHELARVDLTDQRICAVVEADMGIYEIEPHLNKLYGHRLGVVFLKKGHQTYTVRQMDLFMPITLEEIYDKLNFADPAVKCRTQLNKWGGSTDIGGSPRDAGTQLEPVEIVQACREAVRKPGILKKLYHFLSTVTLMGAIVLCALLVQYVWPFENAPETLPHSLFFTTHEFGFMAMMLAASILTLFMVAFRRPWQYGLSLPVGRSWWLLLPPIVAAGVIGGVWLPPYSIQEVPWYDILVTAVIGIPLGSELLFRGLGHGIMAQTTAIQRCDSRWFLSGPTIGSTLAYVVFIVFFTILTSGQPALPHLLMVIIGSAICGLGLGMVRERSQSLIPVIFFHMVTAALTIGFQNFNYLPI